jgi:tripartite-type tricarboxylate transporter receptor subunit TctC
MRSAPDGYTLLSTSSTYGIQASLGKTPFDPLNDVTPIVGLARAPAVFIVAPNSPFKTLRDVINAAKRYPGEVTFGTAGVGAIAHMNMEHFASVAGIRMTHVPYKGAALYTTDLIAGNIDFAQIQIFQATPHVRAGKLRALAVTALVRSPLLPDVPTAQEAGVKGFSSYNWNGLLAPAGTPGPIIDRLHAILAKPLTNPAIRKQLEAIGYEVAGDGPAEFAAFMKTEVEKWAKVARAAGIQPE